MSNEKKFVGVAKSVWRNPNNHVWISGKIVDVQFSHESHGENFYRGIMECGRLSGVIDKIPVILSEYLINPNLSRKKIMLEGEYRSRNVPDSTGKTHLQLYLFVINLYEIDCEQTNYQGGENQIVLNGYLCKPPVYRKTPLEREITDILLAVNRLNGISDYIPVILWGRAARFAAKLSVGDNVELTGRIQSRNYTNGEGVLLTAYEVSGAVINKL